MNKYLNKQNFQFFLAMLGIGNLYIAYEIKISYKKIENIRSKYIIYNNFL